MVMVSSNPSLNCQKDSNDTQDIFVLRDLLGLEETVTRILKDANNWDHYTAG